MLPLIWWIVLFLLTLPGNSRLQVSPWELLLPLLALVLLGVAILIMSAVLPVSNKTTGILVGALRAGGIFLVFIGILIGIFSAIGLTNTLALMFGIVERPAPLYGSFHYERFKVIYDLAMTVTFIVGFTPLWSAYVALGRADQLAAIIRRRKDGPAAIL